jgi:2-C-methyl-D-erythritol 4-phosphate cytidylyltransferase
MPVKDTIKKADPDGFAEESLDRRCLWQIQTPQAFSYSLIRTAYDWIMEKEERQAGITDDAMAVESYGQCSVKLVKGSYENLKVTTPEDMVIAEALLRKRDRLERR